MNGETRKPRLHFARSDCAVGNELARAPDFFYPFAKGTPDGGDHPFTTTNLCFKSQ